MLLTYVNVGNSENGAHEFNLDHYCVAKLGNYSIFPAFSALY